MSDHVDRLLAQWHRERPDVDVSTMGVMGRMGRLYALTHDAYASFWRQHGLGAGEFDVLATLRRNGDPYTLTAGALSNSLMVTGGATTARIDRLIRKGLVERREDPENRRSILISLTPAGLTLIDQMLEGHVQNQRELLKGLTSDEQVQLADLLRKVLTELE